MITQPPATRRTPLPLVGVVWLLQETVEAREPAPVAASKFTATYTGELWRNLRGGVDTGYRYLDQLTMDVAIAVQRERGGDVTGFARLAHTNGQSISALIGDAQAASSIEASGFPLLSEAWVQWQWGLHSLRMGLYDLNSEFDHGDTADFFIGSAHGIGTQFAQSGENGPSIFPATALALRYQAPVSESSILRFAVLDGAPGHPRDPDRLSLRLSADEGLLLVGELDRTFSDRGRIALGAWTYTARFSEFQESVSAEASTSHADRGAYALVEARLANGDNGALPLLDAYLRVGLANPRANRFDRFVGIGLVANETLGIGLTAVRNGDDYRCDALRRGERRDSHEYAIELTWRATFGLLEIQPILQYIGNPDTDPDLKDSLAIALRYSIAFGT